MNVPQEGTTKYKGNKKQPMLAVPEQPVLAVAQQTEREADISPVEAKSHPSGEQPGRSARFPSGGTEPKPLRL